MKQAHPHICALFLAICTFACGLAVEEDQILDVINGGDGSVLRVDPVFDEILPQNYQIERIASGFGFANGPAWVSHDSWDGQPFLLFSDTRGNALHKWVPANGGVTEFMRAVFDSGREDGWSIGPAGLALDAAGNLFACDQGGRRIVRRTPTGDWESVVDRFEDLRLNSPNDLVWGPDGQLYFTDPPFGLLDQDEAVEKELRFNGVFRVGADGQNLEVVADGQSRPNGIGFSPDGRFLYVSNSDPDQKRWMRYPVEDDGSIGAGRVFYDVTSVNEEGLPDGLVLDQEGRLYATGPGGVWVFSPDGSHLGTIRPAEAPAAVAWGAGGRDLYMTARTSVYRIRLNTRGFIQ